MYVHVEDHLFLSPLFGDNELDAFSTDLDLLWCWHFAWGVCESSKPGPCNLEIVMIIIGLLLTVPTDTLKSSVFVLLFCVCVCAFVCVCTCLFCVYYVCVCVCFYGVCVCVCVLGEGGGDGVEERHKQFYLKSTAQHSQVSVHWKRFQEYQNFRTQCGVTCVLINFILENAIYGPIYTILTPPSPPILP